MHKSIPCTFFLTINCFNLIKDMIISDCIPLNFTKDEVDEIRLNSSEAVPRLFEKRNITFNALRLTDIVMTFSLRTIHFGHMAPDAKPECYRIDVCLFLDNFFMQSNAVRCNLDKYEHLLVIISKRRKKASRRYMYIAEFYENNIVNRRMIQNNKTFL